MRIRLILVFALLTSIIVSCNKSGETAGIDASERLASTAIANISAPLLFNHNNPYDSCGLKHNEYLEYIVDHKSQIDIDNWNNDISALLVDMAAKQGVFNETVSTFQTKVNQISTEKLKNSNPQNIKEFVDNCFDSPNQRKYIQKSLEALYDYKNHKSINKTIADIISIENSIASDTSLTTEDVQISQCFNSVAKFSIYYWNNQTKWTEWRKEIAEIRNSDSNPNNNIPDCPLTVGAPEAAAAAADAVSIAASIFVHKEPWYKAVARSVSTSAAAYASAVAIVANAIAEAVTWAITGIISIFGW